MVSGESAKSLPLLPPSAVMAPELEDAVGPEADGTGPACGVMKVDRPGAARPVRIELDPVKIEGDAITLPCIDLRVMRPPSGPAQCSGIGLQGDPRNRLEVQNCLASLQTIFLVIVVPILPEDAPAGLQNAVTIYVEIEVVDTWPR